MMLKKSVFFLRWVVYRKNPTTPWSCFVLLFDAIARSERNGVAERRHRPSRCTSCGRGFPGRVENIFVGFIDEYDTDRRGTDTPLDYGNRQNLAMRGGVTRNLWKGVELTSTAASGKSRPSSAPSIQSLSAGIAPMFYIASELTTRSVTPRLNIDQTFDPVRARMIAGVDVYKTTYQGDRALFLGARPNHVYDIDQRSTAVYAQPTLTFWRNTEFPWAAAFSATRFGPGYLRSHRPVVFPIPAGLPLDTAKRARHTRRHRTQVQPGVRGIRTDGAKFRVPNVDERVGMVSIFGGVPTNSTCGRSDRTIRKAASRPHRAVRPAIERYRMMTDELHFSPITFANVNLDPTLRMA